MKSKKSSNFTKRLICLSIIPVVIVTVVTVFSSRVSLKKAVKEDSIKTMKNICLSINEAYDMIDSGDYNLKNDKMYKGNFNITDEEEFLDNIAEKLHINVSIFYNDVRKATSIKRQKDGTRILNTVASKEVIETVLKDGKEYSGDNFVIEGEEYRACYMPLKNSDGSIVGMIFAGEPEAKGDKASNIATNTIIMIIFPTIIITLILCIRYAKKLSKSIGIAEELVNQVACGNLNVKIDNIKLNKNNEIENMIISINNLCEKLKNVIKNIKDTSDNVMNSAQELRSAASQSDMASKEISRAVVEVAAGATSQATSVQAANENITQIGDKIIHINDSIRKLDNITLEIRSIGNESQCIMENLKESNVLCNEAVEKIQKQIKNTDESVKEIKKAVTIISSIAEETNLLSLNASIEAARAGDAGKGFSVVADKIQSLAEQSSTSAKTIEGIIKSLSQNSQASMDEMVKVMERMAVEKEDIVKTGDKFNDLSRGIDIIKEQNDYISKDAEECNVQREKIADVFTTLASISEENAASTEQTSASMQELDATIHMVDNSAKQLEKASIELEEGIEFFKF